MTLLLITIALAIPTQASAATLWLDGDALRYTASHGQANQVVLSLQPPHGFVLQEDGARELTAIEPCLMSTFAMLPGTGGSCPPAGVERAIVVLGDGHDVWHGYPGGLPIPVRLFGGSGNDRLAGTGFADLVVAGAGEDEVETFGGDDVVYANDGQADSVTCGDGADSVASDPVDDIAPDCETDFVGAPPPTPSDVPEPPEEPTPPGEPNPPTPPTQPTTPMEARVFVTGELALRRARRSGIPVTVYCERACAVDAVGTVARGTRGTRGSRMAGTTFGRLRDGLTRGWHELSVVPRRHVRRLLRGRHGTVLKLTVKLRDLTVDGAEPFGSSLRVRLTRR